MDSDANDEEATIEPRPADMESGEPGIADREMRRRQEAQQRIAEAFNSYFGKFGIRIAAEDAAVGTRRSIGANGWRIEYRIDADDSGLPSMEYYATNRMTNDRHVLIWADGYGQHLDAMSDGVTWNPRIPGAREVAVREAREHDRAVAAQLRARGLYPGSGISAYAGVGAIITEYEGADASRGRPGEDRERPPVRPPLPQHES